MKAADLSRAYELCTGAITATSKAAGYRSALIGKLESQLAFAMAAHCKTLKLGPTDLPYGCHNSEEKAKRIRAVYDAIPENRTVDDLVAELEITESQVRTCIRHLQALGVLFSDRTGKNTRCYSIKAPLPENLGRPPSPVEQSTRQIIADQRRQMIVAAFDAGMTKTAIAEMLKMSKSRVRDIIAEIKAERSK